jgi:hypothetical protein
MRRCIAEAKTLYNYHCENLNSCIWEVLDSDFDQETMNPGFLSFSQFVHTNALVVNIPRLDRGRFCPQPFLCFIYCLPTIQLHNTL